MNNDFFNFCIQQPKAGQRQLDKPTFYRDFILDPQLNGPATFGTQLPSMTRIGPDITFTRSSSATFINQEGNIQVVDQNVPRFEYEGHRTNLRTFSEDFSNWSVNQLTVTSNTAAAPNGSIVAEKLVENTDPSTFHVISKSITIPQSRPYTYSVYLKPAGRSAAYVELYNDPTTLGPFGSGTRYSYFNLTGNGSVFSTAGNATPTIQLINDGWYRCSLTAQASSIGSTLTVVGLASSNSVTYTGNYTGDGSSGLYIWGAQVEVGTTATPYISTGTRPVTVSRPKGLLIEEQRANFVGQQNLFSWSQGGFPTLSAGSGIAGLSSFIVGDDRNDYFSQIWYTFPTALLSSTTYVFSCYIKKNPNFNNTYPVLRVYSPDNNVPYAGINFNQATGQAAIQPSYTLTSAVSVQDYNTYYRASFTFNTQSTAVPTQVEIIPSHGYGFGPTLSGTSIEVAGIQVEQGTFPTSYIPTYGLSAIRAADNAIVHGSNFVNFYNNKEGTLLAEGIIKNTISTPWLVAINDNAYSNHVGIFTRLGSTPNYVGAQFQKDNVAVNVRTNIVSPESVNLRNENIVRVGTSYNSVSATLFANGLTYETNNIQLPSRAVQLQLGKYIGSGYLDGHIRKVGYWPKRLSNTTLRALTLSSLALGKYFAEDASLYTGTGPGVEITRTSSATYFASGGKLTTAYYNRPRFDYDPVTNVCKGLLIEEQRTNLLTYSSQFSNSAWTKQNVTVVPNAAIAPDKTNTATAIYETTDNNYHIINRTSGVAINNTVTSSIFVKANGRIVLGAQIGGLISAKFYFNSQIVTNLYDGVGSIIPVGNGWYRCIVTRPSSVNSNIIWYILNDAGDYTYVGDPTKGLYIWGAQAEEGSFPTSYIPTTNAQVTRTADTVQIDNTNFSKIYNPIQGTFYTKALPLSGSQAAAVIDVGNTYNSIHGIWKSGPGGDGSSGTSWNTFSNSYFLSADAQYIPLTSNFVSTAGTANSASYIAYTYGPNSFATSISSTLISQTTDTSAVPLMQGYNYFNGHVQTLEYYNVQMTNQQLTALRN